MDARVDFIIGHALLDELVGDVVADGEGIEKRTLLEDHAGAGAQGKQPLFAHGGDLLAEEQNAALVGAQQAIDQLEQDALADSGGAEQDARLTRRNGQADVQKNRRAIKTQAHILEGDNRRGIRGLRGSGILRIGIGGGRRLDHMGGKRVSNTWVIRKSQKMIITEENTTASMVERPTPSVPPVVFIP